MVGYIWFFLIVIGVILYFGQKRNNRKKLEEYKTMVIKNYGKEFGESVLDGQVRIGMTFEMVVDALGKPQKIGEKVIKEGFSKEIYYYNRYKTTKGIIKYNKIVILENGKVIEIRTL